ncbi:MAG: hypothetical protein KTR30_29400 [Saprospiraceae bacterium]|nr:hypothetical protein [Saprospiraceae bacterium]
MRFLLLAFLIAILSVACENANEASAEASTEEAVGNPAADGFNEEESDAKAIEWADKVMMAMGGRKSWDTTRYFHWNFFGRRTLLWDKQAQRVRIESPGDSTIYLVNLAEGTGKVKKGSVVFEQPDSLETYVGIGNRIWINDSYWLVMPFKLKDSGVTLNYVGQDTTLEGKTAEVLALTFEEVGVTPQNKYLIYVDPATELVCQWDFYSNADDEAPRFAMPWKSYQKHGDLQLSGDRGKPQLSEIAVFQEIPEEAFTSFDPIDITQW